MVAELDVIGIAVSEPKADSPLIIDGDRVLACPVTLQRVQPITWRHLKVGEPHGDMHEFQLAEGATCQFVGDAPPTPRAEEFLRAPIREGLDHRAM